jgi:uncharacterized protein (DUF58 family)
MRITREGLCYLLVWVGLLAMGIYQQINFIFIIAGVTAGPLVASLAVSFLNGMRFRSIRLVRRPPLFVFSGEPLDIDYTLDNGRRWTACVALTLEDSLAPVDRLVSGWTTLNPQLFFARVPGRTKARLRWQGVAPTRGRYRFSTLELVTRSPFGLIERRLIIDSPAELTVYPAVGRLSRAWTRKSREAAQTRVGRRHDRSVQQQEYHGLRDYRPGDSPRWIHWRTTARLGRPMIREFEQQQEHDIAILIDPWVPRVKVTPEQRQLVEEVIEFAATVCLETCRRQGRRLFLGWTGLTPGMVHGPASVRLLHELLEQLAILRSHVDGRLSSLLDVVPPVMLRESTLLILSTRAINLAEEIERSTRLSDSAWRGLSSGRVLLLNASHRELQDYIRYDQGSAVATAPRPDGRFPGTPTEGQLTDPPA